MTDIANLQLVKGATLRASWFVKNEEGAPVILTGYSAKMQVKNNAKELLLSVSTDDSLSITPNDGGVHIHLTDEQTKDISWNLATYDVFIIAPEQPSGDAYKIVRGTISVENSETQIHI